MERLKLRASAAGAAAAAAAEEDCDPPDAESGAGGDADVALPCTSSTGTTVPGGKGALAERVRAAGVACQAGDFAGAVRLYGEAVVMSPQNCALYCNRSAALARMGQHQRALQDAETAQRINPRFPKAYFRQGLALQYLGRHADALAAFASGLAQDAKSLQLLVGMVEAAMKSPLRGSLGPTYERLQKMRLDKSPFVVVSVIGQELLASGEHRASVVVLEAALSIGSCSLKLRGSVFSALSSAYWALGQPHKAIAYMQQDLQVAKALGDPAGECRALANLGAAHFSQGNYKEALNSHRLQLVVAMKQKNREGAAGALASLGHVYAALGDHPNSLASHKQCALLAQQAGDRLGEARQLGSMGAVYLAMGDSDSALECHARHLRLAQELEHPHEEARAHSNLGGTCHVRRDFSRALEHHARVLELAQELGDRAGEARAYAGLGHACRCLGDLPRAKQHHQRQLDVAIGLRHKAMEGRACSNLGIIHQMMGDYQTALKLHKAHLLIAKRVDDYAGQGRAYGNMGNAFSALGLHERAVAYHQLELRISTEVGERASQASTHGNLAVVYQALGAHDKALAHYSRHLCLARELGDGAAQARALSNLANFHASRGDFARAVPYYEQYLRVAAGELQDLEGEARASHNLGYAHYRLGEHRQAARCYRQHLGLAADLRDKPGQARALCNLGLAHAALGEVAQAEDCQRRFLELATELGDERARFRALGNLADVLLCRGDADGAAELYQKQLEAARAARDRGLEAAAHAGLGAAHGSVRRYDKSLACHTQELEACQEMGDVAGECRAQGHLGAVYTALGRYTVAFKCFDEQLELAQRLKDAGVEARAYGNLGITKMNMGLFEDAVGYFEQQLGSLQQLPEGSEALAERGRAYGNLGDCYEALGDFEEAAKYQEQALGAARGAGRTQEQARAYRGLANAHRAMGNLQQALVCLEKRLVAAHEAGDAGGCGQAYGELGALHAALARWDAALSCLQRQLSAARQAQDAAMELEASSALGSVCRRMGDHAASLSHHERELALAERAGDPRARARAHGNLGLTCEALGDARRAVGHHERQLSTAAQAHDGGADRAQAYLGLGRTHHALRQHAQAVSYLKEGLKLVEQLSRRDEEARIRHCLGLALWAGGNLEEAQHQLYAGCTLLEGLCRGASFPSGGGGDAQLSLSQLHASSCQALQRVLVTLGRPGEALVAAERARSLAERQGQGSGGPRLAAPSSASPGTPRSPGTPERGERPGSPVPPPPSLERLLEAVGTQRGLVLYFSIAAGYLYSWLLAPNEGVRRFHASRLVKEAEGEALGPADADGLQSQCGVALEGHVTAARAALGAEAVAASRSGGDSESASEVGDTPDEESGPPRSLTQDSTLSRRGRVCTRASAASRSLSPRASATPPSSPPGPPSPPDASAGPSSPALSPLSGTRSRSVGRATTVAGSKRGGKDPLAFLYDLLIAPMEGMLGTEEPRELVLVLDAELFLVPFALLRSDACGEFLCERFSLRAVPSLGALTHRPQVRPQGSAAASVSALVVGDPWLPSSARARWRWPPLPSARDQASVVAHAAGCRPLVGHAATKSAVLDAACAAECLHFCTHVSWKLSALVLSPRACQESGATAATGPNGSQRSGARAAGAGNASGAAVGAGGPDAAEGEAGNVDGAHEAPVPGTVYGGGSLDELAPDAPPAGEFLLTAGEVASLRLAARLVVLSWPRECCAPLVPGGFVGLAKAFLAAGCRCVLASLWPTPAAAARVLMQAFYSALMEGVRASVALRDAMRAVQAQAQFSHPSNWAGFVLIGRDVRLNSPSALVRRALLQILQWPDRARDALRVLLHLVEKSLQRIQRGQANSMYTSQQSVENKVHGVAGWQGLLTAIGFRLEPPANGLPAAVFFPLADPAHRLQHCSTTMQALLGLPHPAFYALSKLTRAEEVGEQLVQLAAVAIVALVRHTLKQLSDGAEQDGGGGGGGGGTGKTGGSTDTPAGGTAAQPARVAVKLWQTPGCHELLAALGFDLCEVGKEEVLLRTSGQASRRCLQFSLHSLLALFDCSEAAKHSNLEGASSFESLASSEQTGMGPLSLRGCDPDDLGPPYGYGHMLPASDTISVYSLSSIASAPSCSSFCGDDAGGSGRALPPRSLFGHGRPKSLCSHPLLSPRLSHGRAFADASANGEQDCDAFSEMSSEMLDSLPGSPGSPLSPASYVPGTGSLQRGSCRREHGFASAPMSPRNGFAPSANSPFRRVQGAALGGTLGGTLGGGRRKLSAGSSLDMGDSDASGTEMSGAGSGSREPRLQQQQHKRMNPGELAQKILAETQTHMVAVGRLQRSAASLPGPTSPRSKSLSAPRGPSSIVTSETSAFSKLGGSATLRNLSSGASLPRSPAKPKPPERVSSLQKINSLTQLNKNLSSMFAHFHGAAERNPPVPTRGAGGAAGTDGRLAELHRMKLKYPSSPYSAHISNSPKNVSPGTGSVARHSPCSSDATPSPSHSAPGSLCVSPAKAVPPLGLVDNKVQAVHNLKTFHSSSWPCQQPGPCPPGVDAKTRRLAAGAARHAGSAGAEEPSASPPHDAPPRIPNSKSDTQLLAGLAARGAPPSGPEEVGGTPADTKKCSLKPPLVGRSGPFKTLTGSGMPFRRGQNALPGKRFFPASKC
uniref:Tetratricopeptide repeat protein 28 isoform X2 n=1 Tax=Petromyzon marinus TaxID=7757 RepID=A0AAJ7SRP9_PETMA|nr:tetratricopeptide repeat protein 28 isoform X2 [Petromyzon marinus]